MSKLYWLQLVFLYSYAAEAQIGGKRSFEFLNIPVNARQASLGGVNVSLADRDVNFFNSNPSLSGDTLEGWASVSYQFYVADIHHSFLSYGHRFTNGGTIRFGVQHLDYGTMQGYDPSGMETYEFTGSETALVISKSHRINHFRVGITLKGVFSYIAGYNANALLADIGGLFIHPHQEFTVGLVIKNAGVVLSSYTNSNRPSLPFDVQAGVTFKPEHMPVRFSLTGYNLTMSAYNVPDGPEEESKALDKVLRHFNFGAEVLLHRNVNLMVGYNYRVHQELKLPSTGGGAGVSLGISARVKLFEFSLSRSSYMIGNAGYTFTVAANVKNMIKKISYK